MFKQKKILIITLFIFLFLYAPVNKITYADSSTSKPAVNFEGSPVLNLTPRISNASNSPGNWSTEVIIKSNQDITLQMNCKLELYLLDDSLYKTLEYNYTSFSNECTKTKTSDTSYFYVFKPNGSQLPLALKTVKVTWTLLQNDNYSITGNNIVNVTQNLNSPQKPTVSILSSDFKNSASTTVTSLETGKTYTSSIALSNPDLANGQVSYEIFYLNTSGQYISKYAATKNINGDITQILTTDSFLIESEYTKAKVIWTIIPNLVNNISASPLTNEINISTAENLPITLLSSEFVDNTTKENVTTLELGKKYYSVINIKNLNINTAQLKFKLYSLEGNQYILQVDNSWINRVSDEIWMAEPFVVGNSFEKVMIVWTVEPSTSSNVNIVGNPFKKEISVKDIQRPIVSISGAEIQPNTLILGSKAYVSLNTINSSNQSFKIEYKVLYSTDGTNFPSQLTTGSIKQTGKTFEKLNTSTFNIDKSCRKIKVIFSIPTSELVITSGSRTVEFTFDVSLPTVRISGAEFQPDTLTPASKAYVNLNTTNSSTQKFNIDYKVLYSTDGTNFNSRITTGTLKQTGKSTEKLKTSSFNIDKSYKKIKIIFSIPSSEAVNTSSSRTLELSADILRPTVNIASPELQPEILIPGTKAYVYLNTTNSSTQSFNIDYKVLYSTDGVNFYSQIIKGTLKQTGKSTEKLKTSSFNIDKSYKKIKVLFSIPESESVNTSVNRTLELTTAVSRPTVSISDAEFEPSPLTQDSSKAYVYLNTTNSSVQSFKIDYIVLYSTDGINFHSQITKGTLTQTGKPFQLLKTSSFSINKSYRKIKILFSIPESEDVIAYNSRTLELTTDVLRPTVSITKAGFAPSVIKRGTIAKAYIGINNSGKQSFNVNYKILCSTDGINFKYKVTQGSLIQTGKSNQELKTPSFKVKKSYKKLKVVFSIPKSEYVDVYGKRITEAIIKTK